MNTPDISRIIARCWPLDVQRLLAVAGLQSTPGAKLTAANWLSKAYRHGRIQRIARGLYAPLSTSPEQVARVVPQEADA